MEQEKILQYPQCVTLESFIILKLPLQHGADFYWEDTGMAEYKPTKFKLKTSHYDKAQADFAVGFIECLCHTKGRWAGKPFKLLPWQEQIVRDIFGTLKADGNRQFTTAYIEIPKKNGKSELAAAIALYMLFADGEASPEPLVSTSYSLRLG